MCISFLFSSCARRCVGKEIKNDENKSQKIFRALPMLQVSLISMNLFWICRSVNMYIRNAVMIQMDQRISCLMHSQKRNWLFVLLADVRDRGESSLQNFLHILLFCGTLSATGDVLLMFLYSIKIELIYHETSTTEREIELSEWSEKWRSMHFMSIEIE